MLSKISPELTHEQLLRLLEDAENALSLRDLETVQEKLSYVWTDFEKVPELTEISDLTRAELLKIAGSFLVLHGNFRGIKNSQIHARNLLTRAIEIFEDCGLHERAAKTKLYFGYSYFNTNEVEEFDAIYDLLEEEAKDQKWREILLLARNNRLIAFTLKEDNEAAEHLIKENTRLFNKSDDLRLKAMFYQSAGIFFHQRNKYKSAKNYLSEAVSMFRKLNIERLEASSLNSLSLVYKDLRDFSKAHQTSDQSLAIYVRLNDYGWVPHLLDSKALILLDEKKYDEALALIETAIKKFENSDDVRGLLDAMWTRCLCLFGLKQIIEALKQFTEIYQTALEKIGESIAEKYLKYLEEKVYVIEDLPLKEEIANFKKLCVSRAIQKADGKITRAAKILGYKHQTISNIKNSLFPELQTELKLKPRAKRSDFISNKNLTRTLSKNSIRTEQTAIIKTVEENKFYNSITRMFAQGGKFLFDFDVDSEHFIYYIIRKNIMQQFGIEFDCVVAIAPAEFLKDGDFLLYRNDKQTYLGKVKHEKELQLFFIEMEFDAVFLDDSNIIGKPVGYCKYNAENDPEFILQPLLL